MTHVVFAVLQLPCGMQHRRATVSECERMVERGEAQRLRLPGAKSIGRTRPVYRLIPQPEPSKSQPNPPALRWQDCLLNLGLDPKANHEGVDRREVKRARVRIREYRTVYQHDAMFREALRAR